MLLSRRRLLKVAAGAAGLACLPARGAEPDASMDSLKQAAAKPVLKLRGLDAPVIIQSIRLLRRGGDYFVHVRSKRRGRGHLGDGRSHLSSRDHEGAGSPLLPRQGRPGSRKPPVRRIPLPRNYKLQGLALWCPVAWVEFALLDMLGRIAGKPMGELLGGVVRREVPFYIASGRRDTTPEQEVDYLRRLVEETGARRVKFRVGGRMSRNADPMPGRTEKLIPLARKAFGDKIAFTPMPTAPTIRPRRSRSAACWKRSAPSTSRSPARSIIWKTRRRWPTP